MPHDTQTLESKPLKLQIELLGEPLTRSLSMPHHLLQFREDSSPSPCCLSSPSYAKGSFGTYSELPVPVTTPPHLTIHSLQDHSSLSLFSHHVLVPGIKSAQKPPQPPLPLMRPHGGQVACHITQLLAPLEVKVFQSHAQAQLPLLNPTPPHLTHSISTPNQGSGLGGQGWGLT